MTNKIINEETNPFALTDKGFVGIEDESVRDNVNMLLNSVTAKSYITPYIALQRISKVLANYHIAIPQYTFMEGDHGVAAFKADQFGIRVGMDNDGNVLTKDSDYFIYFEYQMNDDGMFDIFCEIVNEDELNELTNNYDDELEDEESEEMNEENLNEVSKKLLGNYIKKASHDVATKSAAVGRYADRANKARDKMKKGDYSDWQQGKKDDEFAEKMFKKSWNRRKGIAKATDKLTKEETDKPPFDMPTEKPSTPYKNPSAKSKQLARAAMRQVLKGQEERKRLRKSLREK